MGELAKDAVTAVAIVALVGFMLVAALSDCALHSPVNVDPDYPPPQLARDAGRDA